MDYPGGQCSEAGCTGSDIRFVRGVSDAGVCCSLCRKEEKCVYWTYASAEISVKGQRQVCWLKTTEARWLPDSRRRPTNTTATILSRPFFLCSLAWLEPYLAGMRVFHLSSRSSRRSGIRHGATMMSGYVSGRVEKSDKGKDSEAESQAVNKAGEVSSEENKLGNVSRESAQK